MNIKIVLVPINIEGKEEKEGIQTTSLTPHSADEDTEICYSVKCRSPFAKFKLIIVIDDFKETFIQATFCNNSNNITIVNKFQKDKIMFDGFVNNDEGVTVPFVIGPLYSVNHNVLDTKVSNVAKRIQEKLTLLKVFINEAHIINKWNIFKGVFFNNFFDEELLIDNVTKFCGENFNDDVNYTTRNINVTKWVPVLNYVTGKKLINILFIFKFK